MTSSPSTITRLRLPLVLTGLALVAAASGSVSSAEFEPDRSQSRISQQLLAQLQYGHYHRDLEVDDIFSVNVYQQYLEALDPARLYFLESDIAEFDRYQTELDDAWRKGNLGPAFLIFNRFQERRRARIQWVLEQIDGIPELDFNVDENLELDRENAKWPFDLAAADEFWRKEFKNEVLNLRLADTKPEEITKTMKRRYENRLRRVEQATSDDVFRVYMNVLTQSYGPHTTYFPPRDAENFDIEMSLSLEGIGALLNADGAYIKIVRLIEAGPAEKSGQLQAADRIVGVSQGEDGEWVDVVGWRTDEAVDLIRGPKGSIVRLQILGADQSESGPPKVVSLVRDKVKLEEQAAQKKVQEVTRDGRTYKIGVLQLPAFYMDFSAARRGDPNYKSSTRDMQRLLTELKQEGVDGVVVDLRNNGGGSLREAQELTGLFVQGPNVQVKDPTDEVQVLASDRLPSYNGPIAVLVNRLSASASEIFAGAVQDTGRGLVIGGQTFGKGTVQSLNSVGRGQLKLTQAKFYRVSGASTQQRGVEPDIAFPSLYHGEEVGESALDNALPWDEIDPVPHVRSEDVAAVLPVVRDLHERRTRNNPEFQYMNERIDYAEEIRSRTNVSLMESTRREQQDEAEARLLAMENRRRTAQGKEPVEDLDELEAETPDEDELDPLGVEAVESLVDFLTLAPAKTRVVQTQTVGADEK